MFTDVTERRDWIFGVVATVLVIGALYWVRSQPIEEKAARGGEEQEAVGAIRAPDSRRVESGKEPEAASASDSIATVFECVRDGQRVLSDRPCGAGASVVHVSEPNRMAAQDTRVLYQAPPRSVQVQRMRASQQIPATNSARCKKIEDEIEEINDRMRRGYRSWEGERFRERLRHLSEQRHEARCIR